MASSAQALREDAAQSLLHPLTRALLALTFTTGLVDAVSYLGLGHVFTANMTGNVVLLGFGIAGAGGLPVVAPLISLGAFLVGGFAGGALADRVGERHDLWIGATLAIEVAFVTASGIVAVAARLHPATFAGDLVIALLAVAMGVRNATVRKLGVPDLTTTVLTMTLTGLSSELAASGGGGSRTATVRRVAAVVTMLAGAVVGALLVKTSLAIALFSAAAVAAAAALVYVPVAIGWRQR